MHKLTATAAALEVHQHINQTAVPYPEQSTVKELFERCVVDYPERTAVICGGESVTYRDLNRLANGLAAQLLSAGVACGQYVAVSNARSAEMITSLLAIIKCGAAYLPIDMSWPAELLEATMSTFGCRFLLSGEPASLSAGSAGRLRVIQVDFSRLPLLDDNPETTTNAAEVAYLNFTSGTTGTPKGVPILHRSIARLVFAPAYAPVDHRSVVLHTSPVTFDAATFEIWGPLLHGGTCVVYPSSLLSFSRLRRLIERTEVTVVFLTTALFNAIVDEAPATLDAVATVLTGGERYSHRHMATALKRYGPGRVVHMYGPTECTTFATYYPLRHMPEEPGELPIGRPIQNTRLYVVNDNWLCPPGAEGEIMLAGPGLSPGYVGASRTGPSAFGEYEIQGVTERVYRTGDYGYLLHSGELVFTGRRDDQVKVNGFRITLAEISQVLERHPQVKQNYVTVTDREIGERLLCAFVVPFGDLISTTELRDYLRGELPRYMVPPLLVCCEQLPLTANGKVDRRALLHSAIGELGQ